MSTQDFYTVLPAVDRFLDLVDLANYVKAPEDWYVVVTDIVGSTEAIANGRYKDVNLLGASSIIAALNAIAPEEIPFTFGGDGAALLVPPRALEQVRSALLGLQQLAYTVFAMDLRVGVVPVATVTAKYPLLIAKLRLSSTIFQANFMGGGITYATELVKTNADYQLDRDHPITPVDLSGLECRWQDIPSQHGQILTLMVVNTPSAQISNDQIYRYILGEITRIYGDPEQYHPVKLTALRLSFHPRQLMAEIKARAPSRHGWGRIKYLLQMLGENLLGVIFMRNHLRLGNVNWGRYKRDVRMASDCQKLDDTLRMIISSSPRQTQQFLQVLTKLWQAGHIAYGTHISDRALMTCLIMDRRDHHFHLIDGADGGYALAAKALKAQLHRKAQNWRT